MWVRAQRGYPSAQLEELSSSPGPMNSECPSRDCGRRCWSCKVRARYEPSACPTSTWRCSTVAKQERGIEVLDPPSAAEPTMRSIGISWTPRSACASSLAASRTWPSDASRRALRVRTARTPRRMPGTGPHGTPPARACVHTAASGYSSAASVVESKRCSVRVSSPSFTSSPTLTSMRGSTRAVILASPTRP